MQTKQNRTAGPKGQINLLAGLALLVTVIGCVGYEGGGYVDGGAEVVAPLPPPPGVFLFGGDFDRGHDFHRYGHRGYESRHESHERWHRR